MRPGFIGLFKETTNHWLEDNAFRLAAALAYYSIFSIAPLLVIAVSVAGWFYGQETAQGFLNEQLRALLGDQAAQAITGMIKSAFNPSSSLIAGIVGTITLFLGASGIFGELKQDLNQIWSVRAKSGLGTKQFIKNRVLSFGMVLVVGFLLLVSLLLTTVLSVMAKYWASKLPMPGAVMGTLGFLVSFCVITLLFACIFKVLPDVKIQWKQVWIGAAVTALLFEVGKFLLALYLGRQGTASAYGAAASAVLLLMWVYYASLILFYGAEFTQVYAHATGSSIEPTANAEPLPLPASSMKNRTALATPLPPTDDPSGPPKESLNATFANPSPAQERTPTLTEQKAIPILLGTMAASMIVGLLLRRQERRPAPKPTRQIAQGSRALALTGAASAAAFAARILSKLAGRLPKGTVQKETKRIAKATGTVAEHWSVASHDEGKG